MADTNKADSLHAAIMNLPCDNEATDAEYPSQRYAYKAGHRDARHAAAELANEAAARIAELERQNGELVKETAGWREILEAVVREMPQKHVRGDGNAPGHGHTKPGIWDDDNGALAGQPCAWCLTWNKATAAIASAAGKEGA